jgi:hypothetical protein
MGAVSRNQNLVETFMKCIETRLCGWTRGVRERKLIPGHKFEKAVINPTFWLGVRPIKSSLEILRP